MDASSFTRVRDRESGASRQHARPWLRAGAAVLSLAVLAGCGNSASAPECSFFSDTCNPTVGGFTGIDVAFVTPRKLTVQAGGQAVFIANSTDQQPRYQWQRSTDGGLSFADMPGATANALTLSNVQLADDATVLRVVVRGSGTSSVTATSTLLVSSAPGVVLEDRQFQDGDWSVASLFSPSLDGPTHSEGQQATGGNPGAWRSMTHALTTGPSVLQSFHSSSLAAYDPATQGAIHDIDYSEDCSLRVESTASVAVRTMLSVVQAGRRYVGPASGCQSSVWSAMSASVGLQATDFVLVDGAACQAGEACPDFSANAAPLRFGYARQTALAASMPAGNVVHGIDNWKVTVWRQ